MSNQRLGIEGRRVRPSRGFRSISSRVLPLTGFCLALLAACGPTRFSQPDSSAADSSAAGGPAGGGTAPLPRAAAGAGRGEKASRGAEGTAAKQLQQSKAEE